MWGMLLPGDSEGIAMNSMRYTAEKSFVKAAALIFRPWAILIFVCLAAPGMVFADKWMLPTTKTFLSADKSKRLTVYPRDLSNQRNYFSDKVEGKDLAGQHPDSSKTNATATLESRSRNGQWILLWQRALANEVSPVNALVADSGEHIVTFDNWHQRGLGEHVIVIYGSEGRLIHSLSLGDFLPEAYVATLPRSVSSLWWGEAHHFDAPQKNVVLRVAEPFEHGSEDDFDEDANFTEIPVSLANGNVTMPTGQAWEALLSRAEQSKARMDAEQKVHEDLEHAPLSAPTTCVEID